jgi:hypothetical protein
VANWQNVETYRQDVRKHVAIVYPRTCSGAWCWYICHLQTGKRIAQNDGFHNHQDAIDDCDRFLNKNGFR